MSAIFTFNDISPRTIRNSQDAVEDISSRLLDYIDDYISRYKCYLDKCIEKMAIGSSCIKFNSYGIYNSRDIRYDRYNCSLLCGNKNIPIENIVSIKVDSTYTLKWFQELPKHLSIDNCFVISYTPNKTLRIVAPCKKTMLWWIYGLQKICRNIANSSYTSKCAIYNNIMIRKEEFQTVLKHIYSQLERSPLDLTDLLNTIEYTRTSLVDKIDQIYIYVFRTNDLVELIGSIDKYLNRVEKECVRFLL